MLYMLWKRENFGWDTQSFIWTGVGQQILHRTGLTHFGARSTRVSRRVLPDPGTVGTVAAEISAKVGLTTSPHTADRESGPYEARLTVSHLMEDSNPLFSSQPMPYQAIVSWLVLLIHHSRCKATRKPLAGGAKKYMINHIGD